MRFLLRSHQLQASAAKLSGVQIDRIGQLNRKFIYQNENFIQLDKSQFRTNHSIHKLDCD